MQVVIHLADSRPVQLLLPSPDALAIDLLRWGRHDELCSPAYWAAQAWMWELDEPDHFRLGRCLREELLACMLGGYGIPAEVGLAAYARLRPFADAMAQELCDESFLREALIRPLTVGARSVRYRFPGQKARLVAGAFRSLNAGVEALADLELRDELTKLPGVGPKTASWVVRNLRGSDEVAILDVHLLRAGLLLGIFPGGLTVERNYRELESAFIRFARAIGARASILDSVIWMTMRQLPRQVLSRMTTANQNTEDAQTAPGRLRGASTMH